LAGRLLGRGHGRLPPAGRWEQARRALAAGVTRGAAYRIVAVGTQPSELDDFEAVANPARNRFGVVMILAEAPPVGVLLIDNAPGRSCARVSVRPRWRWRPRTP